MEQTNTQYAFYKTRICSGCALTIARIYVSAMPHVQW